MLAQEQHHVVEVERILRPVDQVVEEVDDVHFTVAQTEVNQHECSFRVC